MKRNSFDFYFTTIVTTKRTTIYHCVYKITALSFIHKKCTAESQMVPSTTYAINSMAARAINNTDDRTAQADVVLRVPFFPCLRSDTKCNALRLGLIHLLF